jgi:tetratricopeptide (TPR) repeat protein
MSDARDQPGGARRRRWAGVVAVAAAAGGVWWAADARAAAHRARETAARAAAEADASAESTRRARDIAFYETRAGGDPQGAWDRAQLAALYAQRARESGDFHDYLRADSLARAALAMRTARNEQAFVALVASLLAQHRFLEARDVARHLVAVAPEVADYRAMLGETCLEVGDYAGARAAFDAIAYAYRGTLGVAPRLARWAELRGDTAQARYRLRRATDLADSSPELPREQRAWFHLRMGDLDLRQGRPARAEREFRDGLAARPGDHRLLAAMARLAAVRHRWRDAVRYGDSAVAVALDPATLGVMADAYAALGDSARAAEYVRVMEVAVGSQPGAYHRAWSLFLLDHGRRVPQVLEAARAELMGGRRDVYGYDLLAWALYRHGRPTEARQMMAGALAQGTQDAMLLYHAGLIERAAGDPVAARGYLRRALAVSSVFDAAGSAVARAVLDTLDTLGARDAPRPTRRLATAVAAR